jgi:predicted nucleic acid-binding protein
MAAKVVDASAVCAVLFGETESSDLSARLSEDTVYAPALMVFEVANVCVTKMRGDPRQRHQYVEALSKLEDLAISVVEVDLPDVAVLAEQMRLSAYDASYLWLARQYGVELVTLDKRLAAAAAR